MGGVAADVAGDDVLDAVERAVDRIEAPEAAAGEDECLPERSTSFPSTRARSAVVDMGGNRHRTDPIPRLRYLGGRP